ncbi:uroporphyrinogen-III synthase [Cohnella faecalis]|uniref:Uroporphyrinogen-III synthase n=1 Tax=Cohnella faecalis TaxID=2315694 RepID=A0A398CLV4_9BACL|nr:uroporphyrinogen-III synthase [Cohnella faecalis]RIE02199.1 uroporphyrinogen-III synthase [Cohnella faecalis]
MGKLDGKHIAVTGPRCAEEFTRMVVKMGGQPFIYPAQGTVYSDDRMLEEQIRELTVKPVDWLVLTTGIGTEALVNKAEELGLRSELLAVMSSTRIAARGYKTVNALRKLDIAPTVKADDGTTDGVYRELAEFPLEGARIALQLYGDPSPKISVRLREAGAECVELMPYIHVMPDTGPLDELISRCIAGSLNAVVFTSTVQARCVFHRARETGQDELLLRAFEDGVVAVAVGKVTAEALFEEKVVRVLYPEEERLGPSLVGVGRWFEDNDAEQSVELDAAPLINTVSN